MGSHTNTSLFPLFLISILAFIIPILTLWLSNKIKITIPVVVGEIIAGIIIGKSFLGVINTTNTIPWLDFLYLFGFTYLMFLSGLEVDINSIIAKKTAPKNVPYNGYSFRLSLIYFVLTLVLAFIISYLLKINGYIQHLGMITLILSTTSVGVVVPVLKEKLLAKTPLGQTILLSALLADFLTMVLITIYIAMHANDKSAHNLLFAFIIIGLIIILYRLHLSKTYDWVITRILLIKPIFDQLSDSTSQIKVRGAIALMVIFIFASKVIGIEVILGAFLAGILTTLILGEEKTDQLEMKLDAIGYGFFIPIFFICVGININMNIFLNSPKTWYLLIFLAIAAFVIKVLPSLIFKLKFSFKESISAGILLSSRLSLIIAASTIGLKEGLITEEVNSAIIMVAVFSCIVAPVLFNKILKTDDKKFKTAEKLN